MSQSKNLGVIVTASLAGFLFGFDAVVIAGVTESIRVLFHVEKGSFQEGVRAGRRSAARHTGA